MIGTKARTLAPARHRAPKVLQTRRRDNRKLTLSCAPIHNSPPIYPPNRPSHRDNELPRNDAGRSPHGRCYARPEPSGHERARAGHGQGGSYTFPLRLFKTSLPLRLCLESRFIALPYATRGSQKSLLTCALSTFLDASRHGVLRNQARHVRRSGRRYGCRLRSLHVQRTSILPTPLRPPSLLRAISASTYISLHLI